VDEAYRAADYPRAIALAERALRLARRTFGGRDPKTLSSINNLALFYFAQNRYGEAEPLYREGLQASREVNGRHHQATVIFLNSLATLNTAAVSVPYSGVVASIL
jgi:tetratricopeptide (TPR) repeat protein